MPNTASPQTTVPSPAAYDSPARATTGGTNAVTGGHGARPHAVIIGAGFGGLAAAIRLANRGYRVTVFDRLETPGGRARVFQQDGFTFDAGPTVITAPFLFDDLFSLAGRRREDDHLRLQHTRGHRRGIG